MGTPGTRTKLVMASLVVGGLSILTTALMATQPQGLSTNDGQRVRGMLRHAHEAVSKSYFDPSFNGIDWDARYAEYLARIDGAPNLSAALGLVAGFLDGLQDSHTFFMPPAWSRRVDYGYDVGFLGEVPHVIAVRPDTDAARKLQPGDRILSINNQPVTRESFHRMQYILNILAPMVATQVGVRAPDGTERTEAVESKVTDGRAMTQLFGPGGSDINDLIREMEDAQSLLRHRAVEVGNVFVWRAPTFMAENGEIDRMITRARKHPAVVLDLRGNPGGLLTALRRLVGSVSLENTVVGTRVSRTGRTRIIAATRGNRAYTGKLFVLIDAASASSAELFARVVQLTERGTIIGDRSAGGVREALMHPFTQGSGVLIAYGISVTTADILMADGVSLEGRGVVPDEVRVPSAEDLAAGRDPVMAYAITQAGGIIDAVAAATLFPPEKR
jgi:carboxyl-terminal processing protease